MGQEWFRRLAEGAATGLAAGCALVALSAFAVGSFRPTGLSSPYWVRLSGLRTDTLGVICFFGATVAYAVSESFRWSRNRARPSPHAAPSNGGIRAIVLGAARAVTAAGAVLVTYLSINAATHPWSLALPATHLASWPTESTLRVASILAVTVAAGLARTQAVAMIGTDRD
jgi:hypothetical protein